MAHQIDTVNGDKFITSGKPAWHGINTLGRELTEEEARNVRASMELSGMDWLAYKRPLTTSFNGMTVEVPGQVAVVRGDRASVVGVVGDNYGLIQHTEVFGDMQAVVDANPGLQIDSMFTMDGGAKQVMTLRFKDPGTVKGDASPVDRYLFLRTSYDGSCNLEGSGVQTRVVCANTVRIANTENVERIKIRHSKAGPERAAAMCDALAKITAAHNAFTDRANWLADQKFTDSMFKALAQYVMIDRKAKPGKGTTVTADDAEGRTKANLEALQASWQDPTNNGIRGNAWGAFNAITHYVNHGASYKSTGAGTSENALDSILFGNNAAMVDDALARIQVMVQAA